MDTYKIISNVFHGEVGNVDIFYCWIYQSFFSGEETTNAPLPTGPAKQLNEPIPAQARAPTQPQPLPTTAKPKQAPALVVPLPPSSSGKSLLSTAEGFVRVTSHVLSGAGTEEVVVNAGNLAAPPSAIVLPQQGAHIPAPATPAAIPVAGTAAAQTDIPNMSPSQLSALVQYVLQVLSQNGALKDFQGPPGPAGPPGN